MPYLVSGKKNEPQIEISVSDLRIEGWNLSACQCDYQISDRPCFYLWYINRFWVELLNLHWVFYLDWILIGFNWKFRIMGLLDEWTRMIAWEWRVYGTRCMPFRSSFRLSPVVRASNSSKLTHSTSIASSHLLVHFLFHSFFLSSV